MLELRHHLCRPTAPCESVPEGWGWGWGWVCGVGVGVGVGVGDSRTAPCEFLPKRD